MSLQSENAFVVWNKEGISKAFGSKHVYTIKWIASSAWFTLMLFNLLLMVISIKRKYFFAHDCILISYLFVSSLPFILIVGGDRYHLPIVPAIIIFVSSRLNLITCFERKSMKPDRDNLHYH